MADFISPELQAELSSRGAAMRGAPGMQTMGAAQPGGMAALYSQMQQAQQQPAATKYKKRGAGAGKKPATGQAGGTQLPGTGTTQQPAAGPPPAMSGGTQLPGSGTTGISQGESPSFPRQPMVGMPQNQYQIRPASQQPMMGGAQQFQAPPWMNPNQHVPQQMSGMQPQQMGPTPGMQPAGGMPQNPYQILPATRQPAGQLPSNSGLPQFSTPQASYMAGQTGGHVDGMYGMRATPYGQSIEAYQQQRSASPDPRDSATAAQGFSMPNPANTGRVNGAADPNAQAYQPTGNQASLAMMGNANFNINNGTGRVGISPGQAPTMYDPAAFSQRAAAAGAQNNADPGDMRRQAEARARAFAQSGQQMQPYPVTPNFNGSPTL